MPRSRKPAARVGVVLALCAAGGAANMAGAAQWEVRPRVDVGAVRDSNIRLTTAPHETTTGYTAAADLEVERDTPTSSADLDLTVARTEYTSGDAEDRTEHRARFNGEQRTSERGTLGLRGEYRRDTLFETLVLEEGTGDIRDVDVGLARDTEVLRYYRVLQPSWNWLLSEVSTVHLLYRTSDVNFGEAAGTDLVDYDADLLSATYNRYVTAQNSVHVTAASSRYRPEGDANETDTVQLLVGMGRDFSETLEGSFSIGASRTEEQGVLREQRSSGLALRASLRQEGEISDLEAVLSRDVNPSGIGRALQTDQLRIYWSRQLAPTTAIALRAWWLQTEVVEGFDPAGERRYYELSPRLSWQWLANAAIVLSYSYRYQKYADEAESANSSAVFLGLSYRL